MPGEEALQLATLGLLEWVQEDYPISLNEGTRVLATSIEYKIPTLAGPRVAVVAMKERKFQKGLLNRCGICFKF